VESETKTFKYSRSNEGLQEKVTICLQPLTTMQDARMHDALWCLGQSGDEVPMYNTDSVGCHAARLALKWLRCSCSSICTGTWYEFDSFDSAKSFCQIYLLITECHAAPFKFISSRSESPSAGDRLDTGIRPQVSGLQAGSSVHGCTPPCPPCDSRLRA
jgi:hypothetical protein